ncbi:hypothetical protein KFK09_001111 [Dendrobium nobile]|uniref:Helicase ATP-binding domain-containing protein n=1 Tax=Dendrobium nobile TaxID=94219 RepID=A0A8T3C8R3_DENNO|nr:hypothetical protein KFK09_001111 [Dendrobium nobile]
MPTIRLLLTLALHRQWSMHQLDISNAFLHGDLLDDIYMRQPPGFIDQHNLNAVCKLHKSLYGLKQAPRQWFQKLTSFLQSKGFNFSRADPSLLILDTKSMQLFILIYVDDFLVTGNNPVAIQTLLQQLQSQFALKQLGNISLFLGIQVIQSTSGYFLSQKHYATKLLNDAGFATCKPAPTPIAPESKKSTSPTRPFHDPSLYRRLAGSLQYLSITRPDIAFATNRIYQHMQQPSDKDFQALKRLLRYINGTLSFGLPITVGSLQLHFYSDADWASDSSDRKSISGFCTFLGPNLISWTVKKQATVAKSSTEAEYRSLSAATSEDFDWEAAVREIDSACESAIPSTTNGEVLTPIPPPIGPSSSVASASGVCPVPGVPLCRARQSTLDRYVNSFAKEKSKVCFQGNVAEAHCVRDDASEAEDGTPSVSIDLEAAKTWIYPVNIPLRDYQFAIVKNALFSNTLVALPTGLGKTLIAAVVMYNYFRWFPEGKIVFAAPSRPLVMQQIEACHNIVGIPQEWTIDMTGQMSPPKRSRFWKAKRVFFVTPQGIWKLIVHLRHTIGLDKHMRSKLAGDSPLPSPTSPKK